MLATTHPTTATAAMPVDPAFAAIEAHREALIEFTAEVYYAVKKRKGRWCSREQYREASDAYDAATSTLVSTPIATLGGLRAFAAYIADLKAYGRDGIAGNACCYAIDVCDLSDAMTTVSGAMARLLPADASTSTH